MRPVRAQRSGSTGRTLAAATGYARPILLSLIFPLPLSIEWTRPDDGPLSAFESTSKRRRAHFCRPFHYDKPGSFKMVRKSFGDDLGHDLVRVMDALADLISQREREGRCFLQLSVGRPKSGRPRASVVDVRLRKVITLKKQGDAIGLRAAVDEAVSEIEVCGMPNDPPKAGGGVERAPADVGADQHFLDVVGCEERHHDGMRGDDLFACRGSIAAQFGPRKACRRLEYGEGRDAERRLGGVDRVRVALGVWLAGKNGDNGGGVEIRQTSPHI